MRLKVRFLAVSFCSLAMIVGCEAKQSSPAAKASVQANDDSDGDASGDDAAGENGLVESSAEIQSMTYAADTHTITLQVSYGGCAATKHQLVLNDICTESYPMGCSATLLRPKDFDGTCKMLINEEVKLVLERSFDTSNVSVKNGGKYVSVLVDREGRIEKSMP